MNGFITTEDMSAEEAVRRAQAWPGMVGMDFVKDVTHKEAFAWDPKDEQSAEFDIVRSNANLDARHVRKPLPAADIPIVAFDFGMKYNILRNLRQSGFKVQVLPATTSAAEALKSRDTARSLGRRSSSGRCRVPMRRRVDLRSRA